MAKQSPTSKAYTKKHIARLERERRYLLLGKDRAENVWKIGRGFVDEPPNISFDCRKLSLEAALLTELIAKSNTLFMSELAEP